MQELNISWLSWWRALVVVALAAAAFYVRDVFVVLAVSIIISSAFAPAVSFLERRRIPRILGAILVFAVFLGGFALALYAVVPVVFSEVRDLLKHLGVSSGLLGGLPAKLDLDSAVGFLNKDLNGLVGFLTGGSAPFFEIVSGIFGGALTLIAVFVFSFYLTVGRHGLENFLRAVLPEQYEDYVLDVVGRVRRKIGRWFTAQLFLGLVVGILATLGLWFLGVKYPLALGITAGLFELIPVVGPIFAGTLAFLVAFPDSWLLGLYVIALFFVIQQLENHVLVPLTMKQAVGLHPLIILVSLFVGVSLLGFVGLFLAVPAAVTIGEALEDWSRAKLERRAAREK